MYVYVYVYMDMYIRGREKARNFSDTWRVTLPLHYLEYPGD